MENTAAPDAQSRTGPSPVTVRTGREFLSIPGPTTVPDEVLNAMHRPAVEIYKGPIVEVTRSCLDDLRRVMGTEGRTYIYAANGHGAWEAALCNVLSRGDKVLVLESGRFATAWGDMAAMLGIDVEILPRDQRQAVDPAAVEQHLRADAAGEIKAVLVVQVDTASGVFNDLPAIRRAMDAAGHGAMLLVDTIASLGTMPYEMDAWGIDLTVSAGQKGLMTPPGLSFIAAGEKAQAAHREAGLRTQYWDWTFREGEAHYQKYCGTPPEHLLFGLRKAMDMLFAEGLDNVFARHRILAEAVQRAAARWCEGGALAFNVVEPSERADSVTCMLTVNGYAPEPLLEFCDDKCGVVLGVGIGEFAGKGFRIAHMGYVNAPMILGTLGVVEAGLIALDIPHGKGGVQAAVDWLGQAVPAD